MHDGHSSAKVRRQVTLMLASRSRSNAISILVHAAVILLAFTVGRVKPLPTAEKPHVTVFVPHDLQQLFNPIKHNAGGGGGGGDPTPASKGQLPRVARRQFTPPMVVIRNYTPQLAMEPTLVGAPQTAAILPDIPYGDPNGAPGPLSNGRGKNGGIGDGEDGGVGPKKGPGYGPGSEIGVDGHTHIVGTIKQPVLLVKVDPAYTDEARMAKVQGIVILNIDVDTHGRATNIRLVQGLGLGLDEEAKKAVSQWKFAPGAIDGKPAVTSAVVHVTFRLL